MHYTYYTLSLFYGLSGIEKLTILLISLVSSILIIDIIIKYIKKQRSNRMLKEYLYLKQNKWVDIKDLLTNNNSVTPSDIHTKLEVDLSRFDSRYRDILYHELIKIKQNQEVNPSNWKLFVKLLYNRQNHRPGSLNDF